VTEPLAILTQAMYGSLQTFQTNFVTVSLLANKPYPYNPLKSSYDSTLCRSGLSYWQGQKLIHTKQRNEVLVGLDKPLLREWQGSCGGEGYMAVFFKLAYFEIWGFAKNAWTFYKLS